MDVMQFSQMHQKALLAATRLQEAETEMLLVLQEIDLANSYRELGYTSLTAYMIGELKFSEAGAHHFITACRKAVKVEALQYALVSKVITISKAKTIASVITNENAMHWIQLAEVSTVRELERHVAKENPESRRIEKVRYRSKDQVEITVTVNELTSELLKRAQELLRQKTGAPVRLAEVLQAVLENFVESEDPLRKLAKKDPRKLTEREKVVMRDNGACQFIMPNGSKCGSRYWLDIHHIHPRSEGGADHSENLITLCNGHHRMVHDPPSSTT